MVLDDSKAIRKLTNGLGKSFWSNTLFVLMYANYTHPPPNQKYRSLSEKDKVKKNLDFFNERLGEWTRHLQKAVIDAGVKPDVAEKIPVVAAGYEGASGNG